MNKKNIVILSGIIGGVCGSISPFLMRLSDNWIGGIGIVVIVGCLIGVIGGLIAKIICKNNK